MRYITLALVILTLMAATACGKKSEAQLASDALSRGLQSQQGGRLDEAAAAYREVLLHDPRNKYAFYNLGVIDQGAGRAQAAENNYRLALSVDPDFTPALFNLAILRTAADATQEAIDLYRHVIAVEPNNAGAHLNLGFALRDAGRQAEGDAELQRAVQLDPKLASRISAPATPTPSR